MTMLRRIQAWMRAHRRDYRALSADIDRARTRDQGEMHHPEDRADVTEWGGLGQ